MHPNKRRRLNKPVCDSDSGNDIDYYFNTKTKTSTRVKVSWMNKSNGFDNKIGIDVFKSIILPFLMYYERCAISRVCKLFAFVCPTHFDQPLTKNNNKNGKQNSKNGNWRYSRCVNNNIIFGNNNNNNNDKIGCNEEMIFEKLYWENHLSFELTNGSYFGNKFNLSNGKLLKFHKIYQNQEIYQMLKYFIIYQDFIGINMSLILLSNMREIDLSNNVNIQLLSTIIKLQSKKNNPLPKRFNGFLTKCPKFPTILNNNNNNNNGCNNSSSSNNGNSMMLNEIKECDLTETMIENRNILVSFMIDIFRFKKYDFNKKMSMTTLKSINLSNNYLNDECLYNILINGLKLRVINDIMSPINCCNNNNKHNNNSNNQNGENETFCKNTKNENNNNNNNRKISEKCKIMEKMNDKAENHKNKMLKEEARWLHIGLQNMKSNNNILGNNSINNNNSFFMLTKLDLSNNLFITDKYMPLLFNEIIPNKLPYLQNINLSNNNLTNKTCSVVYNYYKNFHNNSFLTLINLKNNKNITINGVKSYINLIFDNNYLPNGNTRSKHSFKIYFSQSILETNATNNNNNNDTQNNNNSQANKQSNFNHFNGINFNNNNNNNNIGIDLPDDKQIIQWNGNDKIIFE